MRLLALRLPVASPALATDCFVDEASGTSAATAWGSLAVAGGLVLLASRRTRALRRRALWVAALLVLSGFGFRDGPVIPVPTWLDTATGLADGRVLIAGGLDSADNSVHTAWLYEPWSGRLAAAPPMQDGHHFHSAVLLRDGRALIIAGKRTGADQGQLCEAFDPRTEQWSDAGFLTQPRERHVTTLLADGRVLNVGAFNPPWDATAELYDGTTWTAVPTPPMAIRRGEATAVRLADGQVLISGGCLDYCPAVTNLLSTSWLFNPATQVFTATTGLNAARRNHSAMMQADGGVLLIGGARSNAAYNQLATVERLVPGSVVALPNLAQQRDAPNLFRLGDGTLAVVSGRFDAQPIELIAPDGARDAGPTQNRIRYDGAAIPTVDGRFLLAGGYISTGVVQPTMETLELRALSVNTGTSLLTGRERHTATLLPDGRVFVAGGFTAGSGTASTYEFWLPDAGVKAGGSLAVPRGSQTATLLDDQSVLLVGGADAGDGVERCDGVTGCRSVAAPNRPRLRHASVLLHDGRVLVVGGTTDFVTDEAQLELYTPSTNTWADAGFLSVARHNPSVVVLKDGRVLVTAGYSGVGSARVTELFDPVTGLTSTLGNSAFDHGLAPLQLLPDGRVLMAGGSQSGAATTNSEVWNADAGWSTVGALATATASGQALLMRDDRAYVIGGATGATALTNIERFEFDNSTFDPQPALLGARYFHTATLLPTGEVLTVGGLTASGILSTANVLRLGNPQALELQPVLTAPAAALVAGASAHFTGQLLMGVGEASSGDYRSSPAEVPTLRFDWLDNHDVRHLGPTQWTATSADVTLPSTMPAGWYQVTAVVAGVSSAGVFVKVLLPDGTACGTAGVCVSGRCGLGTCGTVAAGVDGGTDGGIDGGSTNTDGGTDGGLDDGGSSTGTTDGGPDGGGGTDGSDADGGPGVVHHYSVGCGCSETSAAWPALTLVALVGFRRRRR